MQELQLLFCPCIKWPAGCGRGHSDDREVNTAAVMDDGLFVF